MTMMTLMKQKVLAVKLSRDSPLAMLQKSCMPMVM